MSVFGEYLAITYWYSLASASSACGADEPKIFTPFIALPSASMDAVLRQEVIASAGRDGLTTFSALRTEVQVPESAMVSEAAGLPVRPAVTWEVASGTAAGTPSMVRATPWALKIGTPSCCAPAMAAGTFTTNAVTFL